MIALKDEGKKGYEIEYEDVDRYCELTGFPYVRFSSYNDYSKFLDINSLLLFLYSEENERSSPLRDSERFFCECLKLVGKNVDYCEQMKIEFNDNIVIYYYFAQMDNFIREYEDRFKHENKKIEKKFNVIAKKLKKVIGLPPWLY